MASERLRDGSQYHCAKCDGLRDTERQPRLVETPPHLVVSSVRFVLDRRTGARLKVLEPVKLTGQLTVPLADRLPAKYKLYAVVVHAGHSLDDGHFVLSCAQGRRLRSVE